jgi:hypothetical protein
VADFYLDQNAPPGIAAPLRQQGHTAVTARDLGMQHAAGADHLLRAWRDRRILVSRDLDYRELQLAWLRWPAAWKMPTASPHQGILVILSDWPTAVAATELDRFVGRRRPLHNRLYQYVAGQGWEVYP